MRRQQEMNGRANAGLRIGRRCPYAPAVQVDETPADGERDAAPPVRLNVSCSVGDALNTASSSSAEMPLPWSATVMCQAPSPSRPMPTSIVACSGLNLTEFHSSLANTRPTSFRSTSAQALSGASSSNLNCLSTSMTRASAIAVRAASVRSWRIASR